jgi:RNA polymerase sigma-70 factor, ECF subfamily
MDKHLQLFRRIVDNDTKAFEILFKDYYNFLCSFSYGLLKEKHMAEEIVEEFFVDLWNNRQKININSSVRSYFISAIHHRCLNYLQREKQKFASVQDISNLIDHEGLAGEQLITTQIPTLLTNELENVLAKAIDKLPYQCREIFLLSRKRELSYEEISIELNISVNTVKTQIKIALSKLRKHLKDYLTIIIFILFR